MRCGAPEGGIVSLNEALTPQHNDLRLVLGPELDRRGRICCTPRMAGIQPPSRQNVMLKARRVHESAADEMHHRLAGAFRFAHAPYGLRRTGRAFQIEQKLLAAQTAAIAAELAVFGDDPVAGDHDGDAVGAVGGAHCPHCVWAADRDG